jgi:single-stranded-DNA-specific exonuclease
MTAPARRWLLVSPEPADVKRVAGALAIDPLLARLLVNRGLDEVETARAFVDPQLSALPDPYGMTDAELAAGLVADAVVAGRRICVYGDYDVDGVTASSLLFRFLGQLGVKAQVFLPDRFVDGYGLNKLRLAELCDDGAQLIIAVDCGTRAVDAVAQVRARGVDMIVCDHHAPGPELPPASALMNPHRPNCTWPDAKPSAVGVALVLAQATRRVLSVRGWFGERRPAPRLSDLLQYAALGTIADMMSLRGFNRIVAAHGLRRLGRSRLPGVIAMKERAHLHEIASADHVGFVLGPRINAAGRVASATAAFTLLTTQAREEAVELAGRVEVENNRRRDLQAAVSPAALAAGEAQIGREHAVVVADPGWHPGVVGIVASKVREHFGVPAFVLSVADGIAKGSGRSIAGYDLAAGLAEIAGAPGPDNLLHRYGGHYFAAGVTLDAGRMDEFRKALVAHVATTLPPEERRNEVKIDAEVTIAALNREMVQQIDRLEPFGKDNPRPTFLLRDVVITSLQLVGKTKDWARLRLLEFSDRPLWGRAGVAAFGAASHFEGRGDGDRVDVIFRLERNHYRGRTTLQATVMAVDAAGRQVETTPALGRGSLGPGH